MLSTNGALAFAIVAFLALGGMWLINLVFAARSARNGGPSKEHLERDGAYGEEGLRRARARHHEHG
jgi:hypothetical protein